MDKFKIGDHVVIAKNRRVSLAGDSGVIVDIKPELGARRYVVKTDSYTGFDRASDLFLREEFDAAEKQYAIRKRLAA